MLKNRVSYLFLPVLVLISCSAHEEYTPPSPIEIKPEICRPDILDQYDESTESTEETIHVIEDTSEIRQDRIQRQEQIADQLRRKRAKIVSKPKSKENTAFKPIKKMAQTAPIKKEESIFVDDDDLDMED